jgi:asparagine synthase (glutamine-hydrolysing)
MLEVYSSSFHNVSNWKRNFIANLNITQFSVTSSVAKIVLDLNHLQNQTFWRNRPGAFAEVFINQKTHEITMVRDHFGIEPFYYYFDKEKFIFGSNLPDILRCLDTPPEPNLDRLIELLTRNRIYSDETFYKNIYSVEPGSITKINAKGEKTKKSFWKLDSCADDIALPNDKAYLDRFSELLHESVAFNTSDCRDQVCGELSGGIDSSAILTTAAQQGLSYPLFMHTATPGSKQVDDSHLAKLLLNQLNHSQVSFINADQFDPIKEFQYCSEQFAGAAPYILFMLSQNINRAVAASGKRILLSGAGGDESASSHASNTPFFRSFYQQKGYHATWKALSRQYQREHYSPSFLKRVVALIKLAHPNAYDFLAERMGAEGLVRKLLRKQQINDAYFYRFRKHTLRELEWDRLQGSESHPLKMRVEYSSVLAKSMGFNFRYPLLYPKLVEFCFHLPLEQKRRGDTGRYLIRQYLKKSGVSEAIYQKQQKVGGIIPGTLDKCYRWLESGKFDAHFSDLPLMKYADQNTLHKELSSKTFMYMLKHYHGMKLSDSAINR